MGFGRGFGAIHQEHTDKSGGLFSLLIGLVLCAGICMGLYLIVKYPAVLFVLWVLGFIGMALDKETQKS